jgi:excisionase family DNA binding protein
VRILNSKKEEWCMYDLEMTTDAQGPAWDRVKEFLNRLEKKLELSLEQPRQDWFGIEQVAAMTGLSSKHIYRAIKKGELACSNVGGEKRPTYRIAREAVARWMEANRVRQAPAKSGREALVDRYFGKGKRRSKIAS